MFTRYEVRNACFKMKKGIQPKNPNILPEIEKSRNGRSWDEFSKTWDVVVKNDQIIAVPSIKDVNLVMEACAKKNLTVELGVTKDWNPEELAAIEMIEAQFLEGIMNWANYKKKWNVRRNHDQERIETYITNQTAFQIEVTPEMVDAKLREAMQKKNITSATLEFRPATEEEKAVINQMLADGKI